jgi:predicted nucleic acid-binding protein
MSPSIVVSDAGPVHYLILIDCADTLEALFDHVLIPSAVRDELFHPNAPKKVRDWLSKARPWFESCAVENPKPIRGIHKGEAEAIQLAVRKNARGILLDDLAARKAAREMNLSVIGTVAVLELAAERNLIELSASISKLKSTNIFVPSELLVAALERDRKRRGK